MTRPMEALLEELNRLSKEKFYGELKITLKDGQPIMMYETKSVRLDNAAKQ